MSSFYLLLPAGLTPFLGIYIDVFGQRIAFRMYSCLAVALRLTEALLAVFLSGLTFLISMLLLKFSHTIPTFSACNGYCLAWASR